jgi:hypothetical protein
VQPTGRYRKPFPLVDSEKVLHLQRDATAASVNVFHRKGSEVTPRLFNDHVEGGNVTFLLSITLK